MDSITRIDQIGAAVHAYRRLKDLAKRNNGFIDGVPTAEAQIKAGDALYEIRDNLSRARASVGRLDTLGQNDRLGRIVELVILAELNELAHLFVVEFDNPSFQLLGDVERLDIDARGGPNSPYERNLFGLVRDPETVLSDREIHIRDAILAFERLRYFANSRPPIREDYQNLLRLFDQVHLNLDLAGTDVSALDSKKKSTEDTLLCEIITLAERLNCRNTIPFEKFVTLGHTVRMRKDRTLPDEESARIAGDLAGSSSEFATAIDVTQRAASVSTKQNNEGRRRGRPPRNHPNRTLPCSISNPVLFARLPTRDKRTTSLDRNRGRALQLLSSA